MKLVASYRPPADDPAGAGLAGRAWTYDSAVTAAALAADGELDEAGALLDAFGSLQRPDGALEFSYDVDGAHGDGPLRSGVQAWVGLAALQWRAMTCSGRHDALLQGVTRWLLERRIEDPSAPGYGLLTGGPDVAWASTEHNLEARAFLAGFAATLDGRPVGGGRACQPGLDGLSRPGGRALAARLHGAVADLDAAIAKWLLVRGGPGGASMRQGLQDDARPLDVQALGALYLIGRGRPALARAVAANADATMLVQGRTLRRAGGQSFAGYRPFADQWGPDVLWMEGTLQMRLAKARLGLSTAVLDDSADRWATVTSPGMPLQADRATGDYHVWPSAAAAAWLQLSRGPFALLNS